MKKILITLAILSPTHLCMAMDEKPTTKPCDIILCTGAMTSGKSRRVIEYVTTQDHKKVIAFQHAFVASIKPEGLSTRNNATTIPAIYVSDPAEMEDILTQEQYAAVTTVVMDEVQFFPAEKIVSTIEALRKKRLTILIAALDYDFRHKSFPATDAIKKIPSITVIHCTDARCYRCDFTGAQCTVRLHGDTPAHLDEPIVKVGDLKADDTKVDDTHYQPCCESCYEKLYPGFDAH